MNTSNSQSRLLLYKRRVGIDIGSDNLKVVIIEGEKIKTFFRKINGNPIFTLKNILEEISVQYGQEAYLGITGVNALSLADRLSEDYILSESIAIKEAITFFDTEVGDDKKIAVIDVGASNQRYYEYKKDKNSGKLILEHHYLQDKCGAGSGLLLEHMSQRF